MSGPRDLSRRRVSQSSSICVGAHADALSAAVQSGSRVASAAKECMLDMRGPARWYDKRNPGRRPSWMPVRVRCSHASAVWLFEQGKYEALVRAPRPSYGKIEEGGLVAIDNHPKSRNNERKIGRTRRARGGQRQPEENGIRRAHEGERLVHADIATAGGAVRQSEHACKKLR